MQQLAEKRHEQNDAELADVLHTLEPLAIKILFFLPNLTAFVKTIPVVKLKTL